MRIDQCDKNFKCTKPNVHQPFKVSKNKMGRPVNTNANIPGLQVIQLDMSKKICLCHDSFQPYNSK